jgi:hypothetical protein
LKQVFKVLTDTAGLEKLPGTVSIFNFFADVADDIAFAIVAAEGSVVHESFRFAENVAVNRGKPVKLFASREEALEWLSSQ